MKEGVAFFVFGMLMFVDGFSIVLLSVLLKVCM